MARRSRVRLTSTLLVLQALFIILFAVFVDYDIDADAKYHPYVSDPSLFHLSDASAAARDGGGSSQNDGDSVTYNGKKSKTGWHIRMVSNSDVAAPPTSNAGTSNAGDAATAETEDRGVNGSGSDGERKRRQISAPTFKNATANESVPLTTESTTTDWRQWVYSDPKANKLKSYYPMFQDVHVMIFVGFGFLMTFLKRYGFGSMGFNFLLSALVVQWQILMAGFLHMEHGKIKIDVTSMIAADFGAGAVLISFGAVLGKTSPLQLVIMAFFEIIFYCVNEMIGLTYFKAVDIGGSMFIHAFGAYFGLAVARVLWREDIEESDKEGSVYHSDLFSMIGTIFLWMYWPSFNGALAPGDDQHRAVINTYLSLAACCVVTFAISSALDAKGRINMVHVQNATLAGGVAIGTSADLMIRPWGAMLVGTSAALISTLGFTYLTPLLSSKAKVHDTCGVNNLHGMPGILAAIAGAILAAIASTDIYGLSLYQVFPARSPVENSTMLQELQARFSEIEAGLGRTAGEQAGYQMATLGVTLGIALLGGTITGFLLLIPCLDRPEGDQLFDDEKFWEVPEEGFQKLPLFDPNSSHGVNREEPAIKNGATEDTKF